MSEKPLHVQVAEALGWTDIKFHADDWWGWDGPERGNFPRIPIPLYDTDWSATGPLIERFRFGIEPAYTDANDGTRCYEAYTDDGWDPIHECWEWSEKGASPLLAVCNLIVALAAAGKLPA